MSVYSRPKDNHAGTVTAYTDSSMTTQIGEPISITDPVTKYTFLAGGSGVVTDTIYLYKTAGPSDSLYFGLQNLQITAQKLASDGSVVFDKKTKTVVKMVN